MTYSDRETQTVDAATAPPRLANGTKKRSSLWWVNGVFIVFVHAVSIAALVIQPVWTLKWQTVLLVWAQWQLATLGITMGYHRLWSHGSYKARPLLQVILAWMGTLGFQGSARY